MHILGSLNPVANQGLDPLSQDTDPRIRIPKKNLRIREHWYSSFFTRQNVGLEMFPVICGGHCFYSWGEEDTLIHSSRAPHQPGGKHETSTEHSVVHPDHKGPNFWSDLKILFGSGSRSEMVTVQRTFIIMSYDKSVCHLKGLSSEI
jgi:hypothetical protein